MTEEQARDWLYVRYGQAPVSKLEKLSTIVAAEALRQNLIAPSTISAMWSRHVVDSAQLLAFAPLLAPESRWLDIGSGAGFPGLVIALLSEGEVVLVEPRKRRAAFLEHAVAELGLASRTRVIAQRVEMVADRASVISARAVAPLSDLFEWASACSSRETRWILPKGRSARDEVASAQQAWQGVFHVEQSITDPSSLIVVASEVTPRGPAR